MSPAFERVFLGWDAPLLPRAAAALADAYADGDALRMGGALAVLPGARAGRRLKELLVAEAARRGLRLVPPEVLTVGALPERLYVPVAPLAGGALSRRAWAEALRGLPAGALAPVFPSLPDDADLLGWQVLAREVDGLHREVGAAGLDFRAVAERCGEGPLFDDGARWQVLAAVQDGFQAELARHGFVDAERAHRAAAAAGTRPRDVADVWLVGVAEMPPVVRRLLEACGARVRALVHAPAGRAADFDALGCVDAEAWGAAEIDIPPEALSVRDTPAAQAEEAAGFLAGLNGRFAAEEITVGVPDDALVPFLTQRLEAAGVPARYAAGTPVERTAPHRLLAALADFLDGRRFPALAALARHPDLGACVVRGGGWRPGPDAWLPALDRFFGARLPAWLEAEAPFGRGAPPELRALAGALARDAGPGRFAPGTRPLSAWMPEILGFLLYAYGDRPDRAARQVREVAETLREAAAELCVLPPALDARCDAPTAIRYLLDEVSGTAIPPASDVAAVEMVGWLELYLDDAPVSVVTGFNEPALPRSVSAHPFLPDALRTHLGLPDNAHRYARDAFALTTLLHARREVRLIAGRRSVENDPLRPSRLAFAVRGPALAERMLRFLEDSPASAATFASPAPPRRAAGPSRFQVPPEREVRPAAPVDSLRVTDFRLLLGSPFLFALTRVLALEAVDDAARELDGGAFGSLAHDVLAAFAETPEAESTDEREIARRLEALLEARMEAGGGARALPGARVQFDQLRARLRAFAPWQARRAAEGWRIWRAEAAPDPGAPFDVDGTPMLLRGRIDRVDHHPERGLWEVLDYKTSEAASPPEATHRRGREKAWTDLQLPLYRHLLRALADQPHDRPIPASAVEGARLGYVLLPPDPRSVDAVYAAWSAEELRQADEVARAVVREVRGGVFRYEEMRLAPWTDPGIASLLGAGMLLTPDDGEVQS